MSYEIGAAREEIRFDARGVVMMGWGDPRHRVRGVKTPLYSRAVAIRDPESRRRLVLVCLDACVVTEALRQTVATRLRETCGLADHELMLSATHTHSAPGGYSTYVFYELTGNGYFPAILEGYAGAVMRSVERALGSLVPGKIREARGEFALDVPVAFNRAVRAYNRNPDVEKVSRKERHKAVGRTMTLLRFDALDGRPIAAWNWFPVHATSIHRDRYDIHGDNKGVAAARMEESLGPGFVAAFAQGAAGDVSPNFRYYFGLREKRGLYRDDEESCRANAGFQHERAMALYAKAAQADPLGPGLGSVIEYHDFSRIDVDPDFVEGKTGLRTGPGEVGLPQLYGTAEGRGTSVPFLYLVKGMIWVSRLYCSLFARRRGREPRWPWTRHPVQAGKHTVIESGATRLLGCEAIEAIPLPDWIDPTVATLKRWGRAGILRRRPFTPQVLPIQLARLGGLAIAAVPAEFTTVAGRRLRTMLERELASQGISRVAIQGYANAYASYVVTPEEYDFQGYEGGCTHFGRYTLPAYLTVFRRLARRWADNEAPEARPPRVPDADFLREIAHPNVF